MDVPTFERIAVPFLSAGFGAWLGGWIGAVVTRKATREVLKSEAEDAKRKQRDDLQREERGRRADSYARLLSAFNAADAVARAIWTRRADPVEALGPVAEGVAGVQVVGSRAVAELADRAQVELAKLVMCVRAWPAAIGAEQRWEHDVERLRAGGAIEDGYPIGPARVGFLDAVYAFQAASREEVAVPLDTPGALR